MAHLTKILIHIQGLHNRNISDFVQLDEQLSVSWKENIDLHNISVCMNMFLYEYVKERVGPVNVQILVVFYRPRVGYTQVCSDGKSDLV